MGFLSKPLPPHQRTKPVAEALPLRWEDACFVPQLGLAVVHADLGVSPQFDSHQPVDRCNSCRLARDVQIIQECEQTFASLQLPCDRSECPLLPKLNNKGISASPCSPPSPCWTVWVSPTPEGLLKPERRGMSRVCVKASPAFGRRRLHTNTDIDCTTCDFCWMKMSLG